ncbi:MAG: hypothetical protein M1832_004872 [Thelocarpon impressellum]|nr:MAG: hypothetical protein M1832_004872 [Thelocarpon impressellum]
MEEDKSLSLTEQPPYPNEPEPIDPEAERRLRIKCDWHVLPILCVLYLLSFLDRVNIGNARIEGLEKELKMSGSDYNVASLIFFVSYFLFEVPSNIILKNVNPSSYFAIIMFGWGVVTVCQGVVTNFSSLVALRFLLGMFESGFTAGSVYLISMYYKRYELQWRISIWFSFAILGAAFGGLFAYALAKMNGVGGYSGWRWIYIIEGLLTVVTAAFAKMFVVDWPVNAKFLTEPERALLLRRLAADGGFGKMDRLNAVSARRTAKDWKIYVGALMYFGVVNTGYATALFIPTIIREMGYTSSSAQLRSAAVNLTAAGCILMVAYTTDRIRNRYFACVLGPVIGTTGYVMLLAQGSLSAGVKYMATFFITCGVYIMQPVTLGWLANNMGGHYKRAIAAAVQAAVGNLGGIVASNIFITEQAPRYPVGYGVSMALLLFAGLMSTVFLVGLRRENKLRDQGGRDYRLQESAEELENMGDDHPSFRFSM